MRKNLNSANMSALLEILQSNKCMLVMQPAQRWCTQGLPTVTFAAPITPL